MTKQSSYKIPLFFNSLLALSSYLFINLVILSVYAGLSQLWVGIGGGSSALWRLEVPLVMLLVSCLYFNKIKNKLYKYFLPILPIIVVYLGIDIFYHYLARAPRPSDLQNLSLVWDFSPLMGWVFIMWCLCILMPLGVLIYQAAKYYRHKMLVISVVCRLLLIGLLICGLFTNLYYQLQNKVLAYKLPVSQQDFIRKNGRINSWIFYAHQTAVNKQTLLTYSDSGINIIQTLYPSVLDHKPNIHLVVLESFIDPRLLQGIKFDQSPLAAELEQYLHNKNFSTVISPTYGGATAQAEFELLTGMPAYGKVNAIEFNVMNGSKIAGFLQQLIANGYQTTASIATDDKYFNAKSAYASLGLQKIDFLGGNYTKNILFDGDVFEFNLKKIKKIIKSSDAPIFNYVLGMYGHFPYDRNIQLRPDVIHTPHADARVQRVLNQFYYRTQALAAYIEQLLIIDPSSIIYIVSDHLPPLISKNIQYKINIKTNISLLLNAGKYVDVSGKHQYEIPWVLWDMLSNTTHNRAGYDLEKLYYKALAESIGILHPHEQ
jgi:hypothetical protein